MNKGAVKLGYTFRFNVDTVGDLTHNNDYVQIKPTYYYVDKQGNNKQEVDLYYSESINGKMNYFVKAGSEMDLANLHSLQLGNTYSNVTIPEISNTARLTGVSENTLKYTNVKSYSYSQITLPSSLKTYIGDASGKTGAAADTAIQEKQRWYGEFRLPSQTYIVPKGYDVASEARKASGLTGKESFWLNNGYIVINFDISVYKYNTDTGNHELYAKYYDEASGVNVWKEEGYSTSKVDSSNVTFSLNYGDIIFLSTIYDGGTGTGTPGTPNNADSDYSSSGTH